MERSTIASVSDQRREASRLLQCVTACLTTFSLPLRAPLRWLLCEAQSSLHFEGNSLTLQGVSADATTSTLAVACVSHHVIFLLSFIILEWANRGHRSLWQLSYDRDSQLPLILLPLRISCSGVAIGSMPQMNMTYTCVEPARVSDGFDYRVVILARARFSDG